MQWVLISKMATHMLRQFGLRALAQPLLRRQSIRLVSSSPRIIFAANKYMQNPFLLRCSLVARPLPTGIRFFADAGAVDREEIQRRVMDVLKLFDKVDPEKISSNNCHFVNDLGLDSLDIVEIVMALEDEFAIEISDEEAEKVFTTSDAVDFIAKALEDH